MALLLCLTFVAGGSAVTAAAADTTGSSSGTSDSIYDSSEVLEMLGTISYSDYLKEANAKEATDVIVIDAVRDIHSDGTTADYTVGEYDGVQAVLTPATGTVAWKVPVDIAERSL